MKQGFSESFLVCLSFINIIYCSYEKKPEKYLITLCKCHKTTAFLNVVFIEHFSMQPLISYLNDYI